jgi:hypothetical protein
MKTDSLTKRLRLLESKIPDEEDHRSRELLGKLTLEELHTLHDIVYRQQVEGIEPTVEEQSYCNALILKYSRTDDS